MPIIAVPNLAELRLLYRTLAGVSPPPMGGSFEKATYWFAVKSCFPPKIRLADFHSAVLTLTCPSVHAKFEADIIKRGPTY